MINQTTLYSVTVMATKFYHDYRLQLKDGGSKVLQKLISIYQNTWCHIPEGHNHNIHCYENLK
jgi:uncharacterized membrane protein YecN with MAPEG domain